MYNPSSVQDCLTPTVTLADAYPYAPTYMDDAIIAASIPSGGDQPTILANILKGSVTKLMGDVIRIKKLTNNVKSVIDDYSLFEGRADVGHKNANQGRFVGLMIKLVNNSDIGVNIFKIAFEADMACPNLNIYLFHSDSNDPINVTSFNYDTPLSVKWLTVTLAFPATDGIYYLGYFESDMATGAASLKKTLDYVNQPTCTSCNGNYYTQYMKRVKYMNIQPFSVDSNNLNGTELFDTGKLNYTDFNNWGLNIKCTVTCDISEFVCRNKQLFYDALSMRYCLDILGYLLMNTRNNAILEQIKDGIIFLRDGDKTNDTKGISLKYEEIIEALNVDLSGFNEMCLPCAKQSYIKRGYIG